MLQMNYIHSGFPYVKCIKGPVFSLCILQLTPGSLTPVVAGPRSVHMQLFLYRNLLNFFMYLLLPNTATTTCEGIEGPAADPRNRTILIYAPCQQAQKTFASCSKSTDISCDIYNGDIHIIIYIITPLLIFNLNSNRSNELCE